MSAAVLMVCLLALVACTEGGSLQMPDADSRLRCADCPSVHVIRVIDGDTFDSSTGRIRMFGVDTPERGERCYLEATERLQELAGDSVRVQVGPRSTDRFGRALYYVYTETGDSIDETLIREGLGVAWTRDGQHRDYLMRLEVSPTVGQGDC